MLSARPRVLFLYWGRRGLSRFALDVARAAISNRTVSAHFSISRQNESFDSFAELGDALMPVTTFKSNLNVFSSLWRIPLVRHQLANYLEHYKPAAVIELMPHVWSSHIAPVIKRQGARYATVVHDAQPHPGDYRSASAQWVTRGAIRQADLIFTLSGSVAGRLEAMGETPKDIMFPLFHPDLDFGCASKFPMPQSGEPIRLLFFGRIMPYKGLPLFLDMVDELRERGMRVQIGVMGEGALGSCGPRLHAMGAEVINRWLTEEEIRFHLGKYHAVVLSHIEASQSGVVATALGAGLPVVATPVGGLMEQIKDGVTGILAQRADAWALADAVQRLAYDTKLYRDICRNVDLSREDRSVARFVDECVRIALYANTDQEKVRMAPCSTAVVGSV